MAGETSTSAIDAAVCAPSADLEMIAAPRAKPRADAAADAGAAQRRAAANKQSRSCRGACCAVFTITFALVPLATFLFAAILTVLLWGVECAKDSTENDRSCDYYAWFLYVMGNLVGLATPLTDISPTPGHHLSEMVDLLVSVWAISLAGTSIGIVGALVAVSTSAEEIERKLRSFFSCERAALSFGNANIRFSEFLEDMRDGANQDALFEDEVSNEQLRLIFDAKAVEGRLPVHYADEIRADYRQHLDDKLMESIVHKDARIDRLASEMCEIKSELRDLKTAVAEVVELLRTKSRVDSSASGPLHTAAGQASAFSAADSATEEAAVENSAEDSAATAEEASPEP